MSGFRKIFLLFSKDFSGTDIYHSDKKKCVTAKLKFHFVYLELFLKIRKIFKTKCMRDQNFFLNLSKKLKN